MQVGLKWEDTDPIGFSNCQKFPRREGFEVAPCARQVLPGTRQKLVFQFEAASDEEEFVGALLLAARHDTVVLSALLGVQTGQGLGPAMHLMVQGRLLFLQFLGFPQLFKQFVSFFNRELLDDSRKMKLRGAPAGLDA